MKTILLALAVASSPVLAHEMPKDHHAMKGEHADAPTSFDRQPALGTWAKCPVSGDVFQVGKDTDFATYNGRVYAFCCPDCKPDFAKNPAKYADKK
ncbi:MAG TPA: YHS domain-containing protein [Myxococcales bacterium]|nr:YHS domain-containing protein [Myxococcales bacterium]